MTKIGLHQGSHAAVGGLPVVYTSVATVEANDKCQAGCVRYTAGVASLK